MEVILRNMMLIFVTGISLLIASSIHAKTEIENKLGIRFYGSFLYSEKVPNALFFFSDIEKNDSFELRKALRNHDIEILVLSSRGGSVWEGLNMAGIIYDKELITYIPKLALEGEGTCASACAFMFFGGSTRIADGKLGVHQFYSGSASESAKIGTTQKVAQFTVSEIIGFLNEFKTPPFVYERMFQQADMYYFDNRELEKITRVVEPLEQDKRSLISSFINEFKVELASLDASEDTKVSEPVKKVEPKKSPTPKKEVPEVKQPVKPKTETITLKKSNTKKSTDWLFKHYDINPAEYTDLVRNIQKELNRLNCNAGMADGIPGNKTRSAAERFLKTNGLIPRDRKYQPVIYTKELLDTLKRSEKKCKISLKAVLVCKTRELNNTSVVEIRISSFGAKSHNSKHSIYYCYPDGNCIGRKAEFIKVASPYFIDRWDGRLTLKDNNTLIRKNISYTCQLR